MRHDLHKGETELLDRFAEQGAVGPHRLGRGPLPLVEQGEHPSGLTGASEVQQEAGARVVGEGTVRNALRGPRSFGTGRRLEPELGAQPLQLVGCQLAIGHSSECGPEHDRTSFGRGRVRAGQCHEGGYAPVSAVPGGPRWIGLLQARPPEASSTVTRQ